MDHLIQSQDEKMGIEKLSNLIKILQLVDGQLSVFSHGIMLLVSSYLPLAFFFFFLVLFNVFSFHIVHFLFRKDEGKVRTMYFFYIFTLLGW